MLDNRLAWHESDVTIACCQYAPRVGDRAGNLEKSLQMIRAAAQSGARLIVLPELCSSGYVFNSREEAYQLSETVPEGDTIQAWTQIARELNVYVVGGICERDQALLYNSAVFVGPQGHLGTFRKLHLWYEEKLFFEPGNLGLPVFHTPMGRIGLLICYDIWFPEAFRRYALQGVDLVCVCTNWVPMPAQQPEDLPLAIQLCMSNAHVNGLFVAAADRVGIERNQPFLGRSVIVGPNGLPLAGPAGFDTEEIILAECNLVQSRRAKTFNDLNHILHDRREDIYGDFNI
ncbi:nitrilase family protein [Alicyclobacillus macrosporangiidus]|uniref:nitrilase family protein n=1 Tax=Alicyclobacillus macrosporangiidus TaxID=392015 RepID=UPI001E522080|nr:nitrilase family protein [Alicyclobacillus macrosporangiidus]